jgi:diguanylate cyclase (GGDEF)-like protein
MESAGVQSLAERLRALQETMQAISSATGFKAMLRRFAEALAAHAGTPRVSFARVARRQRRLSLSRRNVRVTGIDPHPDELLEGLAAILDTGEARLAALREGPVVVAVAGQDLALALADDPLAQGGCLMVWDVVPSAAAAMDSRAAELELLVRHVQNEAAWYRKLDKTQAMLYRDDLTGLYNQRYLEIALDAELRRSQRFSSQFCLLFIDLDGFKPINDQHGHLSGSSCLKQVAEVIRDAVREVDIAIRYGGDEFVVVLLGATSAKGLLAAERVRRRIEQKEFALEDGGRARLTASIGVAAHPEHGADRETLLRRADETMYDSKRAGKNRVTIVGGTPGRAAVGTK